MKPLISFDAAGTLIHVVRPVGETYAEFARQHGVRVETESLKKAFREAWGSLPVKEWPAGQCATDDERGWWHQLVGAVFARALGRPLDGGILTPLFDELYHHFSLPEAWAVYEDVKAVLEDLGRDHQLCVLSNFDRRLRGILQGHGLSPYFSQVILSSEVGVPKPHSRMFATALSLTEADSATSWHVGDDVRCDVEGALQAGWRAFHVQRPESGLRELKEKVRNNTKSCLHKPA